MASVSNSHSHPPEEDRGSPQMEHPGQSQAQDEKHSGTDRPVATVEWGKRRGRIRRALTHCPPG